MMRKHDRRGGLGTERESGGSGPPAASSRGVDALIAGVSANALQALRDARPADWFVRTLAEQYAYTKRGALHRPGGFLRQMAGAPPVQLGVEGFRQDLVDDYNPARHYMAFVFIGFYLPGFSATLMLWLWEIASFVRYRGEWSWPDMASGRIGIAHGRLVRRYGPVVLPGLIAGELAER